MSVPEVIGTVLALLGALTMLIAAVGVVRFPCFFTRLHAAGKGDTLGQGLVLLGLFVVTAFGGEGTWNDAFKLLLVAFFVFIMNATATHAIARAGWIAGLLPWTKKVDGEMPGQCEQYEGQMSDADREACFVPVLPADHVPEPEPEDEDEEGDA